MKTMKFATAIFREAGRIAAAEPALLLLAFALSTVPSVYGDLYLDDDSALRLVGVAAFFLIAVQIIITLRVMRREDWIEARNGPPRSFYPRAIGQGIVWFIAVMLGLALLVVPGVIILIRWSVALPVLLARDTGIIESLRFSWRITRGHALLISATFLITLIPFLAVMVISLLGDYRDPLISIAVESAVSISIIAGWLVQIALYRAIAFPDA
jgi:hypothetical protein